MEDSMSIVGLIAQFNWDSVWEDALRGALIGGCVGLVAALVLWVSRRNKGGGGK